MSENILKENLLEVKELTVDIQGKEILKEIGFDAKSSEITMILGVNGVGKTTLFRAMAGIIKTKSGSVLLDNEDVLLKKPKERAKKIAYCMQNTGVETDANVREFVLTGITPYLGLFEYEVSKYIPKAERALEQFDILHLADRHMAEISGGERQRVYLARSFVQDAKVLLLDEPTTYLDFRAQELFLNSFVPYVKKEEKIAVLTVQSPNVALRFADKIVCLKDGKVEGILKPKELNFREQGEGCLKRLYGEQVTLFYDGQYYIRWRQ